MSEGCSASAVRPIAAVEVATFDSELLRRCRVTRVVAIAIHVALQVIGAAAEEIRRRATLGRPRSEAVAKTPLILERRRAPLDLLARLAVGYLVARAKLFRFALRLLVVVGAADRESREDQHEAGR